MLDEIISTIGDKVTDLLPESVKDGKISIDSILSGSVKLDVNGYVDKVLSLLNEKLKSHGLHEIGLPEHAMDFQKEIACGISVPGKIDFHDGQVEGLASFARNGDASVEINAVREPLISAKAFISLQKTSIEYGAKIGMYCLGPNALASGELTNVTLHVHLQITRQLSVILQQFQVSSNGNLTLNFEGLGIFESLNEIMKADISGTVKDCVLEYLEKSVKKFIDEILSSLPISL